VADQASRVPLIRLLGSETDVLKLVSSLTLFRSIGDRPALRAAADAVLAAAAQQGYPPCAYTLDRLAGRRSSPKSKFP
jgi:hypothetical protein